MEVIGVIENVNHGTDNSIEWVFHRNIFLERVLQHKSDFFIFLHILYLSTSQKYQNNITRNLYLYIFESLYFWTEELVFPLLRYMYYNYYVTLTFRVRTKL